MATFLLYLGPYLGPCSILVTASLSSVYIYSCCSCCGCCRVVGAAIKVTGGAVIGTTYSVAVGIASKIGGVAGGISGGSCGDSCRGYCGGSCRA